LIIWRGLRRTSNGLPSESFPKSTWYFNPSVVSRIDDGVYDFSAVHADADVVADFVGFGRHEMKSSRGVYLHDSFTQ
jgi:hypothetical protein